jgi:6-phosphogluconolactonase
VEHIADTASAAVEKAEELVVATLGDAIAAAAAAGRERATLALSGGRTPGELYHRLAGRPDALRWDRVEVFWGDDRCVPASDVRSNYRLAADSGLLDLPFAHVHRVRGELKAEQAADRYEAELRSELPAASPLESFPRLDLILLGLGPDGHVASLFPDSPTLDERERWAVATEPYQGLRRVTLTLPVLINARHLLFVVTGGEKAAAVRRTLGLLEPYERPLTPARLLLTMIAAEREARREPAQVDWVIDREAAAEL